MNGPEHYRARMARYFHGGAPGLRVGDLVEGPNSIPQKEGSVTVTNSLTGDPLTDQLLPIAVELVGAVHYMGPDEVAEAINKAQQVSGLDENTALRALVVVLAAMVNDDRTPSELLAWWGNPKEYWRLRDLGVDSDQAAVLARRMTDGEIGEPHRRGNVDEVVVERCMAGRLGSCVLIDGERDEVIRRLHARHMADAEIGERVGLTDRQVLRIRHRLGLKTRSTARKEVA